MSYCIQNLLTILAHFFKFTFKSSSIFASNWNNVVKNGPLSLTFAYTMTFYCTSVLFLHFQDLSATLYVSMKWTDPRLTYSGGNVIKLKGGDMAHFWLPDIFFLNEKEGHHHKIIQNNQFLKILPDGRCQYVIR